MQHVSSTSFSDEKKNKFYLIPTENPSDIDREELSELYWELVKYYAPRALHGRYDDKIFELNREKIII